MNDCSHQIWSLESFETPLTSIPLLSADMIRANINRNVLIKEVRVKSLTAIPIRFVQYIADNIHWGFANVTLSFEVFLFFFIHISGKILKSSWVCESGSILCAFHY